MSSFAASNTSPPTTGGCTTCSEGQEMMWSLRTLAPGKVRVLIYWDGSVSTSAMEGDPITAVVTAEADSVATVQDSRTVVGTKDAQPDGDGFGNLLDRVASRRKPDMAHRGGA